MFFFGVVHFSLIIDLSVFDLTRRECFFFRRTSCTNCGFYLRTTKVGCCLWLSLTVGSSIKVVAILGSMEGDLLLCISVSLPLTSVQSYSSSSSLIGLSSKSLSSCFCCTLASSMAVIDFALLIILRPFGVLEPFSVDLFLIDFRLIVISVFLVSFFWSGVEFLLRTVSLFTYLRLVWFSLFWKTTNAFRLPSDGSLSLFCWPKKSPSSEFSFYAAGLGVPVMSWTWLASLAGCFFASVAATWILARNCSLVSLSVTSLLPLGTL